MANKNLEFRDEEVTSTEMLEHVHSQELETRSAREDRKSLTLNNLLPQDPYVTKEYTGFLPESRNQFGLSCAKVTSNAINRQTVENPNAIRLFPDINDYSESRDYPLPEELEYLTDRAHTKIPLTKYTGFVPGSKYQFGERQAAIQARCLVKLKKDVENYVKEMHEFECYRDSLERMKQKEPKYKMEEKVPIHPPEEKKSEYNPYFSGPRDPNKYFIAGYQGHVPSYKKYAGLPNRIAMQYGLVNFYNNILRAKKAQEPTTTYARSLEASVHPPEPPSGGQLYPPQYPDKYRPRTDEKEDIDPIRYQELEKFYYLTGFKNTPPPKLFNKKIEL